MYYMNHQRSFILIVPGATRRSTFTIHFYSGHRQGNMFKYFKVIPSAQRAKEMADEEVRKVNEIPVQASPSTPKKTTTSIPNTPPSRGLKRKRSNYKVYTPEDRAKIARYAIDSGVNNAGRKFGINESTVRTFKKAYNKIMAEEKSDIVQSIDVKPRGKPLLLGKYVNPLI